MGAVLYRQQHGASMKALPKRKGNFSTGLVLVGTNSLRLNESPSQKEGKFGRFVP